MVEMVDFGHHFEIQDGGRHSFGRMVLNQSFKNFLHDYTPSLKVSKNVYENRI
jgi:hypothetical protein